MMERIKVMSVSGKKQDEWVAVTLTDFGDRNRRTEIRRHYSVDAALRAFKEICKIYGRNNERCWQETREGEILNDSLEKTHARIP